MAKRKIVRIDENKCNGCGLCIPNCAEGALKIVNGKAKLVSDALCDGLGACLGHCPQGAIIIEERAAAMFDEKAVAKHVTPLHEHTRSHQGCPGSEMMTMKRALRGRAAAAADKSAVESQLSNWPVQIKLVPVNAPYFSGADILIAADCVPFAYPDFHDKLLSGKVLLIGCPKLDDLELYKEKISQIVANNDIRSIAYARMEVPCCSGLVSVIKEAINDSGKRTPFTEIVVGIKGEILK